MNGSLVGIRKVDFTDKEGKVVKGNQLFIITELPEKYGEGYEFLFAPSKKHSGFFTDDQLAELGIYCGCQLSFSFTRTGNIDRDTIVVTG